MAFDLLTTVTEGGCSAKLSPTLLAQALSALPKVHHERLLVSIDTHDDAGVYKLTEETALVQTVDFFPPVCSDPYDFGRIAAANALSDVYAMGGTVLTAMNLVMFPSTKIPLDALCDMLRGGLDSVTEADGLIVGGHTIDDYPPKYGLSVTGIVHPQRIVTNAAARPGDVVVLAKPLGTGAIIAGKRLGEVGDTEYRAAIDCMKQLNKEGAVVMRKYGVRCGTDITGFGLLGHVLKMAMASNVTFKIESSRVPLLAGAYTLTDAGCIVGAAFRNQDFVSEYAHFAPGIDYNRKMLLLDPQTSGGLCMCVDAHSADAVIADLRAAHYLQAEVIGEVTDKGDTFLLVD